MRVAAHVTIRGVDLVASADVDRGVIDLETFCLVTHDSRPFFTRGDEEDDVRVALLDAYYEARAIEECLSSSYLRAEVEAMAGAAERWLSRKDALDVAGNVANAAELGEDVVRLVTTAIAHRRAKLGLVVADENMHACAAAMAAAWNAAKVAA